MNFQGQNREFCVHEISTSEFSESAIRFSNLPNSKKKYSKIIYWTWNVKFSPITVLCYIMLWAGILNFKFRIVFFGIYFVRDLEIWKTNCTFWKKPPLEFAHFEKSVHENSLSTKSLHPMFDCLFHIRLCFHFCIMLCVHISHTFTKYKQQKFEIQIPLPTSVALDAEHERSSAYDKSTWNKKAVQLVVHSSILFLKLHNNV